MVTYLLSRTAAVCQACTGGFALRADRLLSHLRRRRTTCTCNVRENWNFEFEHKINSLKITQVCRCTPHMQGTTLIAEKNVKNQTESPGGMPHGIHMMNDVPKEPYPRSEMWRPLHQPLLLLRSRVGPGPAKADWPLSVTIKNESFLS